MFKRVYYTFRTLWQHPRYWRGILACPHAEPLHNHHDGCPACFEEHLRQVMAYNEAWDVYGMPSDKEMEAMAQHYEEEGL